MTTRREYPAKDIGDWHITADVDTHHVDFKAYECAGSDGDGSSLLFSTFGKGPPVVPLAEAPSFLTGHVKWDGCSNLSIDAEKDCALHFCGRSSAAKLGQLIDRLYDIAAELMPEHYANHGDLWE